jgi:hypothetical protein
MDVGCAGFIERDAAGQRTRHWREVQVHDNLPFIFVPSCIN